MYSFIQQSLWIRKSRFGAAGALIQGAFKKNPAVDGVKSNLKMRRKLQRHASDRSVGINFSVGFIALRVGIDKGLRQNVTSFSISLTRWSMSKRETRVVRVNPNPSQQNEATALP